MYACVLMSVSTIYVPLHCDSTWYNRMQSNRLQTGNIGSNFLLSALAFQLDTGNPSPDFRQYDITIPFQMVNQQKQNVSTLTQV